MPSNLDNLDIKRHEQGYFCPVPARVAKPQAPETTSTTSTPIAQPTGLLPEKTRTNSKAKATYDLWEPVLSAVTTDFNRVYQLRAGTTSTHWFSRWDDASVRRKVIMSLTGLVPVRLDEFVARLPFQTQFAGSGAIIAAARLLVRLVDTSRGVFSDLRAWFGKGKDELGWFSGMAALSRTNFNIGAVSFEHLLWILDSYYDFAIRFCRIPNVTIANLVQSKESGRDTYGKQCWDLMPLATLLRYSYLQSLHPMAVLTVLWSKEREYCGRKGYIPSLRPDVLVRHLPSISSDEAQRIPRYDQQYLVDMQYAFGLPGDVKLPEKVVFGWDFSRVNVSGLRPVSVTDGGQVVYRDERGGTMTEGHPLPMHPVVKGWGSPALIVWMTRENYAELLPYWYNPPVLCPWSWYSRFGNGIYREDGTAVHPDARLRPPVTWLERKAP